MKNKLIKSGFNPVHSKRRNAKRSIEEIEIIEKPKDIGEIEIIESIEVELTENLSEVPRDEGHVTDEVTAKDIKKKLDSKDRKRLIKRTLLFILVVVLAVLLFTTTKNDYMQNSDVVLAAIINKDGAITMIEPEMLAANSAFIIVGGLAVAWSFILGLAALICDIVLTLRRK